MNPNDRNPGSSRPADNNPPPDSSKKRPLHPEYIEEESNGWFDPEEFERAEKARGYSSSSAPKSPHANYAEEVVEDDDETCVAEEVTEFEKDDGEPAGMGGKGAKGKRARDAEKPDEKGFFEQLGDGLRSAGATAQRYTHIGVNHAGLEKLRYNLKTAHAELGELAMRCWADAPDVGLTSGDPAVVDAVKRVKYLRLKIREKQAKIAQLKKDRP